MTASRCLVVVGLALAVLTGCGGDEDRLADFREAAARYCAHAEVRETTDRRSAAAAIAREVAELEDAPLPDGEDRAPAQRFVRAARATALLARRGEPGDPERGAGALAATSDITLAARRLRVRGCTARVSVTTVGR